MARVLMFVRVMPADDSVNLEELLERIKSSLPEGFEVKGFSKEPLAFGMESLVIGFAVPEQEGASDTLEQFLKSFSEVGEVNVESMSRIG